MWLWGQGWVLVWGPPGVTDGQRENSVYRCDRPDTSEIKLVIKNSYMQNRREWWNQQGKTLSGSSLPTRKISLRRRQCLWQVKDRRLCSVLWVRTGDREPPPPPPRVWRQLKESCGCIAVCYRGLSRFPGTHTYLTCGLNVCICCWKAEAFPLKSLAFCIVILI